MTSRTSIVARALLAVILMVGFYLLALVVVAVLIYLPYAEFVYAHRIHPKLAILCLFGAVAIVVAIVPRIDKFPAPGPRLTPDQHPRLFSELESVARATGQAMPSEVYLIPDVNAWVAQRGGFMGLGSRRVMGLGLPLMRVLTCSQFRAVLAHEFGHYHGGDTKIGPWIYKTRGAIGRTLASLGNKSLLQIPFLWYGKGFLRVTHAVSRRQEFVADNLAAKVIGSKPLAEGLRTIHGVAPAFDSYWRTECAPVLRAGFVPPIAEGFKTFLNADPVAEAMQKHVEESLNSGKSDPYDTHPSLKDRLAALEQIPAGENQVSDPPALSLLENVSGLESQLLVSIAGPDAAKQLKPVDWADVGLQVYLAQWKQLVRANAATLKSLNPESIPSRATDARKLGASFVNLSNQRVSNANAPGLANAVIGAALSVLLVDKGATIETNPGSEILLRVGAATIKPFDLLASFAEGRLTSASWSQQCQALGISGLDLSVMSPEPVQTSVAGSV